MNRVTILFFATLKDRAGVPKTGLELPEGARVADLKARLLKEHPGLSEKLFAALNLQLTEKYLAMMKRFV